MNREKFAWLLSIILIGILALQMPRLLAQRDADANFAATLMTIHRRVMTDYVEQPDELKMQQGACDGMLAQLDPFSTYVPPAKQERFQSMVEGSFKGVGVQVDRLENGDIEVVTPIDNTPASRAGVLAGDIILKVNGQELHGMKMDQTSKIIRGPVGTTVVMSVRHDDGTLQELTMVREDIVNPTVKGARRRRSSKATYEDSWDFFVSNDPKIACVRISQFSENTFEITKKVLEQCLADGMQGLILDLRFNGGGQLEQARKLANLFVADGIIVSVRGRNQPEQITRAKKDEALPPFPMVVLVNEFSASASEVVAGCLKDNNRALIVGTRTYGKGSVQSVIQLGEDEGSLKLTVAYYYLPSGRCVHRRKDSLDWGVEPQLAVPMDIAQQKRLVKQRMASDLLHSPSTTQSTTEPTASPAASTTEPSTEPTTNATTNPTTSPATSPTTQDIDPQLTAALEVLIADIHGANAVVPPIPQSQPATTQSAAASQP